MSNSKYIFILSNKIEPLNLHSVSRSLSQATRTHDTLSILCIPKVKNHLLLSAQNPTKLKKQFKDTSIIRARAIVKKDISESRARTPWRVLRVYVLVSQDRKWHWEREREAWLWCCLRKRHPQYGGHNMSQNPSLRSRQTCVQCWRRNSRRDCRRSPAMARAAPHSASWGGLFVCPSRREPHSGASEHASATFYSSTSTTHSQ